MKLKGLKRQGYFSTVCYSEGWRASPSAVSNLLAQVKELLSTNICETAVIQLLYNSVFFGKTDDGALVPALKGPDGQFHLNGDLEVAGKERQFELLNLIVPFLDLVKDINVVFITPLPRYFVTGCCDSTSHVSNRFQRGFKEDITKKLFDLKTNIKNFIFKNGYRNVTVLDPCVDLRGWVHDDIWDDTDPLHPRDSFYEVIAKSIVLLGGADKRKRPAEDRPSEEPAASRLNSGSGRPKGHDLAASGQRGRGNRGFSHRGGRGGFGGCGLYDRGGY
jgi:hypothetical protein